ncbi:MAG TPA: DUF3108 domain-containing protein [Geminicoccaceae bacterium]
MLPRWLPPRAVRGGLLSRRALLATAGPLLLVHAVAPPWPAFAAPGDGGRRQSLRYQIEVAGVQVGAVDVTTEAGDEAVDARVRWRVDGLLGLLDREKGRMEARGRVDGDGRVVPASFASLFEKPDRKREVSIRYGRDGDIRELELTRDGRSRESEVPERLRDATVDTITAFWRLREWLAAGGGRDEDGDGGAEERVAVFDGRRRYDLLARRLGRETAELDGRGEVRAERVELTLVPRSGFDDGDKVFGSRLDPDEPWAELLVAVGERDGAVPISLAGRGRMKWRITLDGEREGE